MKCYKELGAKEITDAGWITKYYYIVSPLKEYGLIKTTKTQHSRAIYKLSDDWMQKLREDLITPPRR